MKGKYFISILSLLIFEFAGCTYPVATALSPTDEETAKEPIADSVLSVEVTPSPSPLPTITATPQPLGPAHLPGKCEPIERVAGEECRELEKPSLAGVHQQLPVPHARRRVYRTARSFRIVDRRRHDPLFMRILW